ncbi:MAG: hypothetical protein IMW91_01975 [Firmicutes bacterium]|nr:hypothetical protein [Bacillota bacterium]
MASQAGKRYQCGQCGAQVVVTRGGTGDLGCCAGTMELVGSGTTAPASKGKNLQLGKRYKCDECGAEVLVTKSGEGPLTCHGEMVLQEPKKMATSD